MSSGRRTVHGVGGDSNALVCDFRYGRSVEETHLWLDGQVNFETGVPRGRDMNHECHVEAGGVIEYSCAGLASIRSEGLGMWLEALRIVENVLPDAYNFNSTRKHFHLRIT